MANTNKYQQQKKQEEKQKRQEENKIKQNTPDKVVGNKPAPTKEEIKKVDETKSEEVGEATSTVATEQDTGTGDENSEWWNVANLSLPAIRVAADTYREAYKNKATNFPALEASKASFIKTIKFAFKRETLTQADVDYISGLLLHEEVFSEFNLVLGLKNQKLIDVVIYYFAKLNDLKITIVNLPINERHIAKIRKV